LSFAASDYRLEELAPELELDSEGVELPLVSEEVEPEVLG